ncbi:heat shock protein 70 family [Mycena leptocephala]|nr:heat shock protein 70 family [Mycena leptocephala]
MVLRSLVSRAETLHGQPITCAILAIPAHFTDAHSSILHDAAHLADLAILRTVTEPIATAIAHGLDSSRTAKDEQRVLVLDVGSSVSAALLEIDNGVFEILAHARNRWTGGRALDERIAWHAEAVHIRMTGKGREGILGAAQMDVLRVRAEGAKIALSTHQKVTIDVPTNDGAVFPVQLTRREFGEITTDLFEDVMLCAEEVLLEANVAATDVDHIILAGGVASIPRLSELLSTRFSGATALYSRKVRPDETVVYGAALYARHYFDITPLAFGIEAPDGVFTVVLPRNSVLPNTKTRSFNLTKEVRVLVGYGEHISGTHFLGSLVLPPPVGGEVQVRFDMDEAGVLTVCATDASGRSTSTTIRPSEEIDAATARILAELEGANRDIAKAQIQYASHAKLTAFLGDLERFIATLPADHEGRPSADMLVGIIREADAWIAQNLYTKDAEALRDKMMAVERLVRLLTPQSPFWSSGADESQWEERRTEL